MIMPRVVVRIAFRRLRVAAAGIGTAFGVERRFDLDHACAEPSHHGFDDVIAPDTQSPRRDLRRQMTVAQMPGDPNQMLRVAAANFEQRLGCRDHLDQSAIVEHEGVATAQHGRVFQVEQKLKPARARHRHPPPMATVEIEHDGIGRRLTPAMLRADLGRADHANTVPSRVPVTARRPFPA